jgi:ABC-type oligopeptide transport system substrate-binding subunit
MVWSAAILALALTVAACSRGGHQSESGASPDSASSSPATTAESDPAAGSSSSASPETETNTATGEYAGLIDNHSIEIKVDGQPQAFQIDPETAEKVSLWEDGTKVQFQYVKQTLDVDGQTVDQYTITVIDKA